MAVVRHCVSLFSFLALSAVAWSQTIAVVDMQGAILQTKDGQKASTDLKAKYDPLQQGLAKRGQALSEKQAAYQKNAATMDANAKASAERDMKQMEASLQRDADDLRNEAQEDQNKMLQPILQKLQAVLNKYAADKKITMIVDLSSKPNNLLYAAASTNITNDIIALYNQAPATAPPAANKPITPAAPKPIAPAAPKK